MAGLARFVMLDRFYPWKTRVLPTNDVDKDEATATGVSGPPHFVDGQNGAYNIQRKGEKACRFILLKLFKPDLI